jgi:hypothetical protein
MNVHSKFGQPRSVSSFFFVLITTISIDSEKFVGQLRREIEPRQGQAGIAGGREQVGLPHLRTETCFTRLLASLQYLLYFLRFDCILHLCRWTLGMKGKRRKSFRKRPRTADAAEIKSGIMSREERLRAFRSYASPERSVLIVVVTRCATVPVRCT